MNEVVIRSAHRADLASLPAIEVSAAEAFARVGQPLPDGLLPGPAEQWARALADGLLWVADDPERGLVGFLAGVVTEDGLHIQEMDVIVGRQRQGHGRSLMFAALAEAKELGLRSVTLTTFRNIPWNGPFYASLGFMELTYSEMSPPLAAHLLDEVSRGLHDRCAMRRWI